MQRAAPLSGLRLLLMCLVFSACVSWIVYSSGGDGAVAEEKRAAKTLIRPDNLFIRPEHLLIRPDSLFIRPDHLLVPPIGFDMVVIMFSLGLNKVVSEVLLRI